jgi:O-antigen ligase
VYRRDWLVRSFILFSVGSLVVASVSLVYLKLSGLESFLLYRLKIQPYDADRFSTQFLALETIGQMPFGIGPGHSIPRLGMGTHNLYLQIAVENGFLSAFCFFIFLAITFWTCVRHTRRRGPFQDVYACCFAILAGILANSLAIDSLHWRHFFLFLAVPVGLWQHEFWASRTARPGIDLPQVKRLRRSSR